MPVPRRFDRRPPERDQTRINERIRVPEVRLVGEDGKQIGVVKTSEALAYAQQHDLDLVEVAPEARPPVCRVLDYSKYKYEQAQKLKAARRHQQQITIREIKFRPKIAQNDYDTKKGHVERFLKGKDKVKITIMFRGREVTHPERGVALLQKLAGELAELAVVEQQPLQDGRNMTMMLGPSKAVLAGESGAEPEADPHGKPHRHKHGDDGEGNGSAAPAESETDAAADAAAAGSEPPPAESDAPAKPAAAKGANGAAIKGAKGAAKSTVVNAAAAEPAAAEPAPGEGESGAPEPAADAEPSGAQPQTGPKPKAAAKPKPAPKPTPAATATNGGGNGSRPKAASGGARPAKRGAASEAED